MIKALLDENLPLPLVHGFSERLEVFSVHDQGWSSLKNGELLTIMSQNDFTHLITADQNLEYQQNLDAYPIQVVILYTFDNRYHTLKDRVPEIERALLDGSNQKVIRVDLRKD